jgi:hypothetical protein
VAGYCAWFRAPKKGIVWRIGNGQNVHIWRDRWIAREPSGGLITTKGRCRLKWVSELISLNGTWDIKKIRQYFLPVDVVEIQKIKLSPRLDEDFVAWAPEKSGIFSVRSAYKLASDEACNSMVASTSIRPDGTREGWNYIWKSSAPPKV